MATANSNNTNLGSVHVVEDGPRSTSDEPVSYENLGQQETRSGSSNRTAVSEHNSNGNDAQQHVRMSDDHAGEAAAGNGHHHHGMSEKIDGLRQRAKNRGHSGATVRSTDPAHPTPERTYSTGIAGFMQRIGTGLSEPRPKIRKEPTWKESGMNILKASWLNVLLVFIPVSWACHFAGVGDTVTFVMAFLAIIPLAKLLGFGTEEISCRVGQTLGGLLNATLGNVVELIVAILALVKCELQIVQSSLIGSILSNLLLVLGMCFFVGGLKFSEQQFGDTGAQINSSLLVISVIAILIPAGFHAAFGATLDENVEKADILAMSRGTAVIVLFIYIAFMVFQLWSHTHLFNETGSTQPMQTRRVGKHTMFREAKSVKRSMAAAGSSGGNEEAARDGSEEGEMDDDEGEEEPTINLWSCIILLLVVAALVGVTAEWLVDSINGLVANGGISAQWVGLILLPIVGNAAEHVTAVTVSYKDKLDLSIGVAVGSSIQVALFLIPVLTILGWILDKPLSLLFDPFESIVLFLSVLLANYTMQDSRSNWLEGWILCSLYLTIAVAFWYYPASETSESRLLQC